MYTSYRTASVSTYTFLEALLINSITSADPDAGNNYYDSGTYIHSRRSNAWQRLKASSSLA